MHDVQITSNEAYVTMPKTKDTCKAHFQAALKLAGVTQKEWAEAHEVTPAHLWQVLTGKRESRTLMEKVESFTKKHVRVA